MNKLAADLWRSQWCVLRSAPPNASRGVRHLKWEHRQVRNGLAIAPARLFFQD